MSFDFGIGSVEELKERVRYATSYTDDSNDGLPESQLESIIRDAQLKVYLKTGSDAWFTDDGLGLVLFAYTCMRVKASVENFAIVRYAIGDETVTTRNADPEDSQQIQMWADDVRDGLNASSVDTPSRATLSNTAAYIGESHYHDYGYHRDDSHY